MKTHSRPLNRPTPGPSLRWRGIECPTNEAIYSPSSQGGAWGGSLVLCTIYYEKDISQYCILCLWYCELMFMVP